MKEETEYYVFDFTPSEVSLIASKCFPDDEDDEIQDLELSINKKLWKQCRWIPTA